MVYGYHTFLQGTLSVPPTALHPLHFFSVCRAYTPQPPASIAPDTWDAELCLQKIKTEATLWRLKCHKDQVHAKQYLLYVMLSGHHTFAYRTDHLHACAGSALRW